ncbi:hypothetical protein HQ576_12035 [bacterium]|nr:hypothetical protein [bacterium]
MRKRPRGRPKEWCKSCKTKKICKIMCRDLFAFLRGNYRALSSVKHFNETDLDAYREGGFSLDELEEKPLAGYDWSHHLRRLHEQAPRQMSRGA